MRENSQILKDFISSDHLGKEIQCNGGVEETALEPISD